MAKSFPEFCQFREKKKKRPQSKGNCVKPQKQRRGREQENTEISEPVIYGDRERKLG